MIDHEINFKKEPIILASKTENKKCN